MTSKWPSDAAAAADAIILTATITVMATADTTVVTTARANGPVVADSAVEAAAVAAFLAPATCA